MRMSLKVVTISCLLLFVSCLFIPSSVQASQIVMNGSLWNSAIAVNGVGNVAVIGSSAGFGTGEILAFWMMYNPQGQLVCFRTFGDDSSPLDTFGYGVAFDTSNNIYVTGATQTFGGESFNVFIIRYDSSCNQLGPTIQWASIDHLANDIPRGITVDTLDNVYVTGYTTNGGQTTPFLLKYAGDGEFQYSKTWGGVQNTFPTAIDVDTSGNVYITGYSTGTSGASRVFLVKFDPAGNLLSQQTWGGGNGDYSTGVAVDGAGNIYLTGYTYSYSTTPGVANTFLLKFDPYLHLLFQKTWGDANSNFGSGVSVDLAGNVYVTGYSYGLSSTGTPKVVLLKFDPSGNLLMDNTWGGNRGDYGYAVGVDPIGNVYVTGYTYSFGPNTNKGTNFFVLKYDSYGSLVSQTTYGGGQPLPYLIGAPVAAPEFDTYYGVMTAICSLAAVFCIRIRKR